MSPGKASAVKKGRWLKWVIWTPCIAALLFFAGLIYFDRKVAAELRREEELFLAMGVDVREVHASEDAGPDYEALGTHLGSGKISEALLRQLEKAAEKPVAFSREDSSNPIAQKGLGSIYRALLFTAREAAKNHDWPILDRLFQLHMRIQQQCAAAHCETLAATYFMISLPLMDLKEADSETRMWLRRKLEAFDLRQMHAAHLAGIARLIGRGGIKRLSTLPSDPWWKRAIEKQTIFRQSARLALLRQWRTLVEQRYKKPSDMSALNKSVTTLRSKLVGLNTWPAEWAARPLGLIGPMFSLALPINMTLVEIDLRDQRELGKPPVPTWSKRYLIDPDTGSSFRVRSNAKGIDYLFKGKFVNAWGSHVNW